MYVVENFNKNILVLIFLQGAPFIIWLINLISQIHYWIR